jgi:hypothetical protein
MQMNKLRLSSTCLLLLASLLFFGCTPETIEREDNATVELPLTIRHFDSPAASDSREPNLFASPDGRVILNWVEKSGENRYALRFAVYTEEGWSEARTVAEGDDWFINWADFPSVIRLADNSLAAHWLVKSGRGTYAYDVNIARSGDGGSTWSKPVVPHTDNTQTEHGFVSLLPLSDGQTGVIWLDGRNLSEAKSQDHGASVANMTLRYAAIDAAGKLADESVLDERVCECCQTAATITETGAIVVYRDRSADEVRDIYVVRHHNGAWSRPQPVHTDGWKIEGCPVNGPSIATSGQKVAVAWYTEADDQPRVNIAFSGDFGTTFGTAIQVDDGHAVGRVSVTMLEDGSAYVCWLSGTVERGAIKVRKVVSDGRLGPAAIVGTSDISRSSGFPRLARIGDQILFAWTEFGKPSFVRTATATLN